MLSEKILCRVKDNPLVKKYMNGEFTEKIYFLNAEGGYGKSTSFKSLYYYLVEQGTQVNNHIVPILVDVKSLAEFGEEGVAGNMPRPIEKYIVKNYCGADSDPDESLLTKVVNLFSKNNAPKFQNDYTYCIFIDAINEVNDELKRIIIDEIKQMAESDFVKFFISSRVNESSLPDDSVKYKLLPLDEEKIRVYLDENFGKTGEKVDISKINDSLVDILRVPMYLSVFRKTYDERNPYPDIYEEKTVRKADILDSFIQKLLKDNMKKERSDDKPLIEFVVSYFLPALAFKMYNSNLSMQLLDREFRKLRNDFDYFDSLLVPDEYLTALNAHKTEIKSACLNLGIVSFANGYYTFTHQNWRDLFVAKHIINCMNSEKLDELEITVSENIRQFVGELIREYKDGCGYSKDYMDKSDEEKPRKSECDFKDKDNLETWQESPVEHFLQCHNLKSQDPLSAVATRNLIEIMKTSRNGRITAKYDDLDLKSIYFYSCNLEKSTFYGTKLYNYNIIQSGHRGPVHTVSFSPNSKKIVSGSADGTVRIWDSRTGISICAPLTGHMGSIYSVFFSPDGKKIVSGGDDKTIRIWDAQTGKQIGEPIIGHEASVNSVSFSPDGKKIVSGSADRTIRIWDAQIGEPIREPITGYMLAVKSVSFSPDGKKIVSGHADRIIRIWDAQTGKPIGKPITGHAFAVPSVSFSSDGKKLVSGSADGSIRIWDAQTGEQIGTSIKVKSTVNSVSFSPDSKKIVSGSSDGTIRIWDTKTGEQIGEPLIGDLFFVYSAMFSSDGKKIVSGGCDGVIRIWDSENFKIEMQIGESIFESTLSVKSVSFSPDGKKIVSESTNGTLLAWDSKKGILIGKSCLKDMNPSLSSDGKKLAVRYASDFTSLIWDYIEGKPVDEILKESTNWKTAVSFSTDGKKFVSGNDDGTIRIWDAQTGKQIGEPIIGHEVSVNSVSFSSDGKKIVSGSADGTIRIWDAQIGKPIGEPITGYMLAVRSVSFSPDGKKLVSGNDDGTIRIWDAQTGKQIGEPIIGHEVSVNSVSFSPGGKKIVSGSDDGNIKIWDLKNYLCTIIKVLSTTIINCDFRNAEFNGEDESEFYGIIYSNGGIVKDEFVPKPVPFEFSDKIKRKEKI